MKMLMVSAVFFATVTTTGMAAEPLASVNPDCGGIRLSDAQMDAVTAGIKDLGVFFLPEPANRIPYDQVILIFNPGSDRSLTSEGIVETAQAVGGLGRLSTGRP